MLQIASFAQSAKQRPPRGLLPLFVFPVTTFSDSLPNTTGTKILTCSKTFKTHGNVGTLIRTAAAFNFSGVILSDKCADPLSQKCIQSTAGTVLSVWIRKTTRYLEFVDKLKKNGYSLIAADLKGMKDSSMLYNQDKLLLALGNEASGLSESILNASNHRFQIPIIRQRAESLNVAVCGAICMYLSSCK